MVTIIVYLTSIVSVAKQHNSLYLKANHLQSVLTLLPVYFF